MPTMSSNLQMLKIMFGILLLVAWGLSCSHAMHHFNVVDYGAIGDGRRDDSLAFLRAWNAACNGSVHDLPTLVVPRKPFLVSPIIFQGPCAARKINFMIVGTIIAPGSPSFWDRRDASQWLVFEAVNGLSVYGFGTIDGSGKRWWDQSCRDHPQLKKCTTLAPTAIKFLSCNGTSLTNLRFTNSPQAHILVTGCNNFKANNVVIDSPDYSPNTDGIHIQSSRHVSITNSKIGCGDDCISIGDYIFDVRVANVACGPGHGISVGSLGRSGNYVQVEKIHVADSSFNQTTNGARIKTWQVGRGYVRGVTFENLTLHRVENPVIIDQNYCDVRGKCRELKTGVQVTNITYKEIHGTSSTKIAINLNCSRSVPCYGITMENIHLKPSEDASQITSNCSSAYGKEKDVSPGPKCLLP